MNNLKIKKSLDENISIMSNLLHYPTSNDIQLKKINIRINNSTIKSALFSYDGLVDNELISNYIIRELSNENKCTLPNESKSILKTKQPHNLKDILCNSILANSQINCAYTFSEVIEALLHGDSALFVEGEDYAIICDTKKIPRTHSYKVRNRKKFKRSCRRIYRKFQNKYSTY